MRANPNKDARGIAIEANLDKGRGAVATVLVEVGTLARQRPVRGRYGPQQVASVPCSTRRQRPTWHGPSRPVQVLGLSTVPRAGDTFLVTATSAPPARSRRSVKLRTATPPWRNVGRRLTLEDLPDRAVRRWQDRHPSTSSSRVTCPVPWKPSKTRCSRSTSERVTGTTSSSTAVSVGITQNDVNLATVDSAVIIGFKNVKPAERVAELVDREGVDMRLDFSVHDGSNRRHRGCPQGHAQAGMSKRPSWASREVPGRCSAFLQVRQHRRLDRALGAIRRNAKACISCDGNHL